MVRIADEYIGCACRVQQENPKRQKSAERYEKYKHGRTLREVLDLGASRASACAGRRQKETGREAVVATAPPPVGSTTGCSGGGRSGGVRHRAARP